MLLPRIYFFILIFIVPISEISSECVQSFMTTCETFEDFENYKEKETLTELMIGTSHGDAKPSSVNLMKALELGKLHKLTTLVISRAINQLEMTYAFECTYTTSPLKYLTLYGNQLKVIEEYHFPVLPLKKLNLASNKIEGIKTGAFTHHEVENLDLSNNLLEEIESEALPSTNATKSISIRNNQLSHIEERSFPMGLKSLDLAKNNLRYLQEGIFQNLPKLQELDLSYNKFKDIPGIKHLKQLVTFDISFNSITKVEERTFESMPNLKFVDLSNNKISDPDTLKTLQMPNTLTISLAFNSFKEMNLNGVSLDNKTLALYGNPWDCKTWPQFLKKIEGHRSECDMQLSSAGDVPFCYDFVVYEYFLSNKWEKDVEKFQEVVRRNADLSSCNGDRYRILRPIYYGCVA